MPPKLQVFIEAVTEGAQRNLQSFSDTLNRTISVAAGTLLRDAFIGGMNALKGLATEALGAVGNFERLELTLGNLVKRDMLKAGESLDDLSDRTRELLDWTRQLAKESPFDATNVVNALRTAMAYGFTAEEAKRLTQATLDYAAGAGLSSDSMNQIALALGQIGAKGKLAGQEVLQLVNAGLDVRQILADKLGKSVKEISAMLEKGKIDSKTAIDAIVESLEKDFGGAAKQQTETVNGFISTLGELKAIGLDALFRSIFDAVKPLASLAISWLEEEGIERLRTFGTQIGEMVSKVVNLALAIADAGVFSIEFYEVLDDINPNLAQTVEHLEGVITKGLDWIRENGDAVKGALTGIAIAFGALAIIGTIAGLLSGVTVVMLGVTAVAGLLGAAWNTNFLGIRDTTIQIWNNLQPAFESIRKWLAENIPIAIDALRSFWENSLKPALDSMAHWFRVVVPQAMDFLRSFFQSVTANLQNSLDLFSLAFQGKWYEFGVKLREIWESSWDTVKKVLMSAGEGLKTLVSSIVESIKRFFQDTDWGAVGKAIIDGIASGVKNYVSNLVSAVKNAVSAALQAAKGFLEARSPSRLFEREIGQQMIAGWVRGIESRIPRLEFATERAGEIAFRTAQSVTYNYNLTVQSVRSSENILQDFLFMRG